MDAIVFENNTINIKNFNLPQLSNPFDILIKVKAVGLCKTDLMMSQGLLECNQGQILGHEFSGIIEETGSKVANFKIGDKVAINPVIVCKTCTSCLSGSNNCSNYEILGINKNGALTEYIIVPAGNIYKIPDNISFEIAAYLEPVAAALSMLNINFTSEKNILIFGSGRIARLSYLILKNKGFENVKVIEDLTKIGANESFDIIIENGINNDIFNKLIKYLNIEGTFILKSRNMKEISFNVSEIIRKEINLKGVNYSNFSDAYNFLVENHQFFKNFIGNSYSFADYKKAFADSIHSDKFKHFITLE